MKLSELVEKAIKDIEKYGDYDVKYNKYDSYYSGIDIIYKGITDDWGMGKYYLLEADE